jgi:hypothetical protein
MASKLIRWAGAAAASILALILLLLAVAHLPFVRTRVLERARAYAARDLGISLEADGLDYSLLTRSASLRNVAIAAPGQPTLLHADSAVIVLSRRLFRGTIEIEQVELVRPRITIVRHPDGTTNLPASSADDSQRATPLELGTINIRELSFALDDRLARRTVAAGPIDLRLDSSRANAQPVTFGPSPFTIETAAPDDPETLTLTGTLAGRLAFDGARLSAPELRVETPEGRIALDGWADLIAERPLLEARGHVALDLARARRFAGRAAASLAGTLDGSIHASGPLVDPALRLTVEGRDLAYRSFTGAQLSATGSYGAGRLDVQRLRLTSRLGGLNATGHLKDGTSGQIAADWSAVDLDRLIGAAGVDLPVTLGSTADGRLTATLKSTDASDRGWLRDIEASGTTRFAPANAGLSLSGRADLTIRSGDWSLTHAVSAPTAHLALDGSVRGQLTPDGSDTTFDRGTRLRIDDLAAIVPILREAGVSLPPALADRLTGRVTSPRGMPTRR